MSMDRLSEPATKVLTNKPTFKQVSDDVFDGLNNFASITGIDKTINAIKKHPATAHLKNAMHSVAKSAAVLATNTPPGQIAKAVGVSPAKMYNLATTRKHGPLTSNLVKKTPIQVGQGRRLKKRRTNRKRKQRKYKKHTLKRNRKRKTHKIKKRIRKYTMRKRRNKRKGNNKR
jgi:hypothetical protein